MSNKPLADMGQVLGNLTQEKNEAYGDSFRRSGEILEILYPDGIQPHQYRDALGIVRVIDKLFRIATRKDAFGESPWRDIGGYAILGAVADTDNMTERRKEEQISLLKAKEALLALQAATKEMQQKAQVEDPKTGFDRYFEEQMKIPGVAEQYEKEYAEISANQAKRFAKGDRVIVKKTGGAVGRIIIVSRDIASERPYCVEYDYTGSTLWYSADDLEPAP